MKRVYLNDRGVHLWWNKFYNEVLCSKKEDPPFILDEVLAPYNCRYGHIPGYFDDDDYLEFKTENDYLMFVLRWS